MEGIGFSEIAAALIGAIAAGGFQTVSAILDRRKKSEAVLTAIASEVDSICRLIQHQRYLEAVGEIAAGVEKGMWNGESYVIDIRSNYFAVFESLADELGHLKPHQTQKIVNFYAYCKSAIDSTRPDGSHALEPKTEEAAMNMVSVAALLQAILNLGNEIIQMPKLDISAGSPALESQ
ncbi:hypothetical protein [Sphingorhabdus sp. EL138]|uniref:hypothetical protein n=1 Tax=Sphingorhabdus sp. EL138 TaxID=2073156 RepID=UPI000D68D7BE|nr:hypothetical protein [Sphingorhabdus sp. EL138]